MIEQSYTPDEVCKALKVSRKKVIAWANSGRLRAFNVNNKSKVAYRIPASAIVEFQAAQAIRQMTKPRKVLEPVERIV